MHYHWRADALVLHCHAQPGASRDRIVGLHGERLKIQICAPPVDDRANARLLAFLAAQFGVAKAQVCLEHGARGRRKTVAIQCPMMLPEAAGVRPPERNPLP